VIGAGAALAIVVAGKLTFDAILDPPHARLGLATALLLLAFMTALSGSMGALQSQQQRLLSERVSQRIWDRVVTATTRVDLIKYERAGFATQLERVTDNAVSQPYQVTTSLLGLSGSLLSIITMSVALVGIEPLLVPILLAASIPAALLSRRAARVEYHFADRTTRTLWKRSYLRSLLTHRFPAAELRAFDAVAHLQEQHRELDREYVRDLRSHVLARQAIALLATLGVGVTLAAALLVIVELTRRGQLELAEAGAAAIAVRMLSQQLSSALESVGSLIEAVPFLADLEAFLATESPAVVTGRKRELANRVELKDIHFTYPEQRQPAVDGVDLEIRAGEVVALVGENGSGKTTLAMIAAGLLEPGRGVVAWDGDEDVPAADVRASASIILQDFVEYQMTIRDNITISDSRRVPREAEVVAAARRAGALRTIEQLPDGFDTVLSRELDEGLDLSGGQWQRVALARALYRDAPLVVMDEPTAALDPRAEYQLFADVRQVLDGRAALLISHRFSSVKLADRIYVLDAGRVLDSGTHEELMARRGQYAELFELQSAAYR
jgi:ATP-binding cassette subfamily B protein